MHTLFVVNRTFKAMQTEVATVVIKLDARVFISLCFLTL